MAIGQRNPGKISDLDGAGHRPSSPISAYSQRHAYRLEERHAAWKVFLPISSEAPILAVGLKGSDLASLARSWKVVHSYKCAERDLEWAAEQAESLGHKYQFEPVVTLGATRTRYPAIAVNAEFISACDPAMALRLLVPGGSAVWVGPRRHVPFISGLARQGYYPVRRYAILPPGTGKILVPLRDSRLTRAGLNLYRPGKRRNRVVLRIGHLSASLGCQCVLGWKQVVVARKPGRLADEAYLFDWLGKRLGHPIAEATIYTGSNQARGVRKPTIQLLDEQGQVIGIAKVADIGPAMRAVARETSALKRLEGVPELRDSVPRILATGEWLGHTVQVQTAVCIGTKRYTKKLTPAHLKFLTALSRIDRCEIFLEKWPHWVEIWRWAHEGPFASASQAKVIRKAVEQYRDRLSNTKIPFHRVHGDFAPWNALSGPNGLAVVDWEDSEPLGLPFCDLVHFAVRVATLLENKVISLEQLLYGCPSVLDIDGELNALMSSPSLLGLLRFTPQQMEALVRLCIMRDKMEELTGFSFAGQERKLF